MTRTGLHISKLLKVVVDDDDDDDDDDDGEVTMMTTATMMMMMMMIGNVKKRNYRHFSSAEIFRKPFSVRGKRSSCWSNMLKVLKSFTKKKDVLPVSLRTSSPAGTLRYSLIKSQPISIHPLLGLRYSNF